MLLGRVVARRSDGVEANFLHRPVRPHPEQSGRSHGLPRLLVCGLTLGLFPPGRVGYPEPVEVNGFRINVIGIWAALQYEAEQRPQRILAHLKGVERERVRTL